MRKNLLASVLVFILIFTSAGIVSAHPGRTDSNGGHYCRTNCEKWGLKYGEYHYHNGGGSSSSSPSTSKNTAPSTKSSTAKKNTAKPSTPAYQESDLIVDYNGQKVSFNTKPVLYENTNLVPLREIAEAMSAAVTWDQQTGTIGVTKDNHKMTLTIGSTTVFYNGTKDTISTPPRIIKAVTYVPVQVFARGLGANVEYDEYTKSLHISS